jgi:hypothetical protein
VAASRQRHLKTPSVLSQGSIGVVILGPRNVAAMCRGAFFQSACERGYQASLRDACQFDAGIRGLKPHGYRQETAPRSFKTSRLQTPLQRDVTCWEDLTNRFNGFSRGVETAEIETVFHALRTPNTPLKQAVNEKCWPESFGR